MFITKAKLAGLAAGVILGFVAITLAFGLDAALCGYEGVVTTR